MKKLNRVSRWISVRYDYITDKHSLYYYADKGDTDGKKAWISYFIWKGKKYAVDQFVNRWCAWGFDKECKEYPAFICGYDTDGDYFNPLLIELDKYGEKVRLYMEE